MQNESSTMAAHQEVYNFVNFMSLCNDVNTFDMKSRKLPKQVKLKKMLLQVLAQLNKLLLSSQD